MANRTRCLAAFLFLLSSFTLRGNQPDRFKNAWEIGFTFGEIPFLSGSFKPGLTLGFHLNDRLSFSTTYQLKDYLERNDQSYNARNIGLEGLLSSKETTGERLVFAVHYRPVDWSPYLVAGLVINRADIETMRFDNREREIGENTYRSVMTLVQKRGSGIVPALGFGYRYDFDNGLSLNTNMAMGFFNDIATPEVTISGSPNLSEADSHLLKTRMDEAFRGNFHNRYHIFNLGVLYRF